MRANEVRDLETEELHVRIAELKEELFNLRFQLATGQLDNHRRMQQVKRDVARIRTVLRDRDFAVAEASLRTPAAVSSAPEAVVASPAEVPSTPTSDEGAES